MVAAEARLAMTVMMDVKVRNCIFEIGGGTDKIVGYNWFKL
jgi:hypothetical protein